MRLGSEVEAGKKEDALKIADLEEGEHRITLSLRCGKMLLIKRGRVVVKDGVKSLKIPGSVFHSNTEVLRHRKIK